MSLSSDEIVRYLRDPVNRRGARTFVELLLGVYTQKSDLEVLRALRDALTRLIREMEETP